MGQAANAAIAVVLRHRREYAQRALDPEDAARGSGSGPARKGSDSTLNAATDRTMERKDRRDRKDTPVKTRDAASRTSRPLRS